MDVDKKKLIEKLKVVKDPQERDRIIWAIAGLEKNAKADISKATVSEKTDSDPSVDQTQNIPALPAGIRHLVSYFVPALFLLFGVTNIIKALMHILPGGDIKEDMPPLIMGAIFLLFGVIGIIKAGRKASHSDQNQKEGGHAER